MKLLPEVEKLTDDELRAYALQRARDIAEVTPGEPDAAWEAAELAHAVVRLLGGAA